MENNDYFLVQVFFYQSTQQSNSIFQAFSFYSFTILHATWRSSDLRRAACTVANPPLPSICDTS